MLHFTDKIDFADVFAVFIRWKRFSRCQWRTRRVREFSGCKLNRSLSNCAGRGSKIFNKPTTKVSQPADIWKILGIRLEAKLLLALEVERQGPGDEFFCISLLVTKKEKRGQRELYYHSKHRPTTLILTAATRLEIRDHSHSPLKFTRNEDNKS